MEALTEDGGYFVLFFLFLVQYAVHKSLAHKILRFLSISFVVKWVHCHFVFVFFIKILWIIDMTCVCFLLLSIPKLSFFVWSLFDRKDQCTHIQTRWRYDQHIIQKLIGALTETTLSFIWARDWEYTSSWPPYSGLSTLKQDSFGCEANMLTTMRSHYSANISIK